MKVVAAILIYDKKVLAFKRPYVKNKPHVSLKYEFPGGKIEDLENIETNFIRKVYDECGTSISVLKKAGIIKHAYSHFKITLHCYFCRQ